MRIATITRRSLLLPLAALVSSCANVPAGYQFDPSRSDGLIVGTITYDGSLGLYSLFLTPSPSTDPPKIDVGSSVWPALTPQYDSGLKATGGTFAVAVPAGQYKIHSWQVKQGARVRESSQAIEIALVVEKGRATYIGNLHFSKSLEVSLRDRSARDLPVLQAKYEVLKSAPLTFTIEKDADLKDLGGRYQQGYQAVPVFIPIPVRR